jgi:hypothetical protein
VWAADHPINDCLLKLRKVVKCTPEARNLELLNRRARDEELGSVLYKLQRNIITGQIDVPVAHSFGVVISFEESPARGPERCNQQTSLSRDFNGQAVSSGVHGSSITFDRIALDKFHMHKYTYKCINMQRPPGAPFRCGLLLWSFEGER